VCHLARAAPRLRRKAHEHAAAAPELAAALTALAALAALRHAAGLGLDLGRRRRERGGEHSSGGSERRGRQAEQYVVGARRARRV